MDEGPETISDTGEMRQVRRQARAVYVKSAITAAILTAVVIVL